MPSLRLITKIRGNPVLSHDLVYWDQVGSHHLFAIYRICRIPKGFQVTLCTFAIYAANSLCAMSPDAESTEAGQSPFLDISTSPGQTKTPNKTRSHMLTEIRDQDSCCVYAGARVADTSYICIDTGKYATIQVSSATGAVSGVWGENSWDLEYWPHSIGARLPGRALIWETGYSRPSPHTAPALHSSPLRTHAGRPGVVHCQSCHRNHPPPHSRSSRIVRSIV